MERLRTILRRIDGKGYKAYKDLKGTYRFPDFTLFIDHVQGDPFALPSRVSVRIPAETARLPEELWSTPVRRIALEDFLGRSAAAAIAAVVKGRRGSGRSGQVGIATSGQQVLRRNAVLIDAGGVEARLTVALPAAGRTVLGREAEAMLFEELPQVVAQAFVFANLDRQGAECQVLSVEDQDHLRRHLTDHGLIAFVADGALLPRRSGIDDRPLGEGTIPFCAPESLAVTIDLPYAGPLQGLGIPEGVTVIVGGGFHGKSTLLHALERGVYNHRPGDGREKVVTEPSAVKIRAEDGRAIHDVDISPFIRNLPLGRDTVRFRTENASGSTSQAANIIEALECGAGTLLIDEDTSATNFMIRDRRMQQLVSKEKEPITPLLHRVRELHREQGVSSVIVMGGSGDYLDMADTVIMLDNYRPRNVTAAARRIAVGPGVQLETADAPPLAPAAPRHIDPGLLSPARHDGKTKIEARGTTSLLYGRREIDLGRVEQLVDSGQTRAIGLLILYWAEHHAGSRDGLAISLGEALEEVDRKGLDVLTLWKSGDLALPRLYETAAALNRFRGLSAGETEVSTKRC